MKKNNSSKEKRVGDLTATRWDLSCAGAMFRVVCCIDRWWRANRWTEISVVRLHGAMQEAGLPSAPMEMGSVRF